MSTTSTQQLGFTLVGMMITVATLAILSIIAIPSYDRYIERGCQSQTYAELVVINSAFKSQMVKSPRQKTDEIKTKLDDLVSSCKGYKNLVDKYKYSAEIVNVSTSRAYRLRAISAKTGYTLSVWMDSLGNTYKYTDMNSANNSKATMTDDKDYEPVSKRKPS